jgi:hypothetical protein
LGGVGVDAVGSGELDRVAAAGAVGGDTRDGGGAVTVVGEGDPGRVRRSVRWTDAPRCLEPPEVEANLVRPVIDLDPSRIRRRSVLGGLVHEYYNTA